ncbi:pyridoxamine 5'-phosphate oxidase family protein [Massilia sp. IC2-476]|uniref:pyridoxamine 5'-phosphate oxidase family protein n=1 Tax=Massilia sp. IC2-476 TaxID=2887199 RepID=UPI001D104531|nr:pyridoxamine 5'-phosphate oxidase family protein [Massilia sp. IC2-476]MCC2971169.1 pyridoxamine 5'-phosphate oxidase family protein [Massilia sp. IC2-476]
MNDYRIPQPFHAGELRAQQLAGGGPPGAPIRSQMPDQHRQFFALLPFVCVALADGEGWPLATLLHGEPGFASSPEPGQLRIAALPDAADPAHACLHAGADVGLLGIDLGTRRRNRENGVVAQVDGGGLLVDVHQSFGNCPRYIHVRRLERVQRQAGPSEAFGAQLPSDAARLVAACETMFVATSSGATGEGAARGLDISHRGGEAGFLRLQGHVLHVPDYAGNRYFNTLGNLLLEPRAALVMIDFDSGDILQLQGMAEVDWHGDASPDPAAERWWKFSIERGWLRRGAFPLREAWPQA